MYAAEAQGLDFVNDNDTPDVRERAHALIADILTMAWPTSHPHVTGFQFDYLKGMLAEIAAHDPHVLSTLELHREIIRRNNEGMGL